MEPKEDNFSFDEAPLAAAPTCESLTLRDRFAIAAMASEAHQRQQLTRALYSECCYLMADAMLNARNAK